VHRHILEIPSERCSPGADYIGTPILRGAFIEEVSSTALADSCFAAHCPRSTEGGPVQ
jgi:hypothetical protein